MNKNVIASNISKKHKILLIILFSLVFLLTGQSLQAQTQVRLPVPTENAIQIPLVSPKVLRKKLDMLSMSGYESVASNREQITAPNGEGDVDTTFNGSVTEGLGSVEQSVVQPDGKILVAGSFSGASGAARKSLARINPDGSFDATFNPGGAGPSADIYALVLQPDGKILIGGNGALYNGITRGFVTRLNADGTPDATFNTGYNTSGSVSAIAVQPDGKILIGGFFNAVYTVLRNNLVRLNADGTLDLNFNSGSGFNSQVDSLVLQPDGKILASGYFTQFNGAAVGSVARLNADGTLDGNFNLGGTGADTNVEAIALQPDGKILVAGFFNSFNGAETPFGLVRLNAGGTIENSFNISGLSADLTAVGLLPDGTILLGGTFTVVAGGQISTTLGTSVITTTPNQTFQTATANNYILDFTVQPDGKVLVGGNFTQYNGVSRRRLVRLNANGTVDDSFQAAFTTAGIVYRVLPQPNGKTLIGGDFEFVNDTPKKALARLNPNGSLDTSFNVNTGSVGTITQVLALAAQPADGKILVGGSFGGGTIIAGIVRLNADGSRDQSFNPPIVFSLIFDIEILPDGKILLGGAIESGGSSKAVVRLNSDGSLDNSFNSFSNSNSNGVSSIALQDDGKIVVGGRYLSVAVGGGLTTRGAVRLNADGSIDPSFVFRATTPAFVNAVAVLPGGKILLAGNLYNFSKVRRSIYRVFPNGEVDPTFNQTAGSGASGTIQTLAVRPDGRILIGGHFTVYNSVTVNRVASLNADGTLDQTFNTGAGADEAVLDIALRADGKILLGGTFTTFNNQPRASVVRLNGTALNRRTPFDFDGDGRADVSVFRPTNGTWYIEQSINGITGVAFGSGTDKIVPADYDGDGKTDVAVFRGGTWYLNRSSLGFTGVTFGDEADIPMPGDYDGDGKADIAVFRPSNGIWYLQQSQLGFTGVAFGQNGDIPVAADYDGDGKTDIAVFRGGTWYLNRSQAGFTGIRFGDSNDKPVPADFDGDGNMDVAVFRPSNGTWYLNRSQAGFTGIAFGLGSDTPAAADYDGDGKADVSVFRSGTWYLQRSLQGFLSVAFGAASDQPVPGAFVP